MDRKKLLNFLNFIRLILSLGILYITFYIIGFNNILNAITNLNQWILFVFLIVVPVTIFLSTLNIYILLRAALFKISLKEIIPIHFRSWSISLFTPAKLGEFSLVYFLKKKDIEYGSSIAVIIADKIITFLIMLLISVPAAYFFADKIKGLDLPYLMREIFIIILLVIFTSLVLFTENGRKLIVKTGNFLNFNNQLSRIKGYAKTVSFMQMNKKYILINAIITILRIALSVFAVYIAFIISGYNVKYIYILLIQSLLFLVSQIPITFSGLGLREGSAVFLYSLILIPEEITLIVYLAYAIVMYVFASVFIFSFRIKSGPAMKESL